MRLFSLSLILLLVCVAAAAQNQLDNRESAAPAQSAAVQGNAAQSLQDALEDRSQQWGDWRGNIATCFAIRSYLFERRDNLAPEFVGMTTCTPARNKLKRTEKPPTGRLVPLTSPADNIQK